MRENWPPRVTVGKSGLLGEPQSTDPFLVLIEVEKTAREPTRWNPFKRDLEDGTSNTIVTGEDSTVDIFSLLLPLDQGNSAVVDVIARFESTPNPIDTIVSQRAAITRQGNFVMIGMVPPATRWTAAYSDLVRRTCLALHERPLEAFSEDPADESTAIQKIKLFDGELFRDDQRPGQPVTGISLRRNWWFRNQHLYLLKSFQHLRELDLHSTPITDRGLRELGELPNLTRLDISETKTTEAGQQQLQKSHPHLKIFIDTHAILSEISNLRGTTGSARRSTLFRDEVTYVDIRQSHLTNAARCRDLLKAFPNLTSLELSGTQMTPAIAKELGSFHGLTSLNLSATAFTDADMQELQDLKNLQTLNFSDTQITDLALKEISAFQNLTTLWLSGTKTTEVGVKELKKRLPKTQIICR